MAKEIKKLNDGQRKYVASIFGLACVAWASPVYNTVVNFHTHDVRFSPEYCAMLVLSIFISAFAFSGGFKILGGTNDGK